MKKYSLTPFLILMLVACATVPDYKPIVDTTVITDFVKYEKDYQECEILTNSVDYSDQKTAATIKGAAVGAGVVGAGAAVTLATGGIVLAPVILPIYAVAALIGGKKYGSATIDEETKLKAIVWNSCLKDRGYKVFSNPNY